MERDVPLPFPLPQSLPWLASIADYFAPHYSPFSSIKEPITQAPPHTVQRSHYNAILIRPNEDQTAVRRPCGCHCPSDITVRMREVLARQWAGVCVLLFSEKIDIR